MVVEWNDSNMLYESKQMDVQRSNVVCVRVCLNYNLYYVGICFSPVSFCKIFCNYLFKFASYVKKVFLNFGHGCVSYASQEG